MNPSSRPQPLAAYAPADWFDLPPESRRSWFTYATPSATAAFLLLEHAARRQHLATARDWLKQHYLAGVDGDDAVLESVETTLARLLDGAGFATRPATLLEGHPGYGLPQWEERRAVAEAAIARREDMEQLQGELELQADSLLDPALREGLEAIDVNIAVLGERLRAQQRENGGFVLP